VKGGDLKIKRRRTLLSRFFCCRLRFSFIHSLSKRIHYLPTSKPSPLREETQDKNQWNLSLLLRSPGNEVLVLSRGRRGANAIVVPWSILYVVFCFVGWSWVLQGERSGCWVRWSGWGRGVYQED
jgi:hypothetical protein